MLRRYRQRRGPYALATPSVWPSIIRSLILLLIVGLILYYTGRAVLNFFGGSNQVARSAVVLNVDGRGTVNVSLEGGLMQRAEDQLKLYPGDKISTGNSGNAELIFFDGTRVRLDQQTEVMLEESLKGTDESTIAIALNQGGIVVRTPSLDAFSGSIARDVTTSSFSMSLPSDTEAAIDGRTILVFSADDEGVALDFGEIGQVSVGEGQQLELPEGEITGSLTGYRSAIDALAVQSPFIEESRLLLAGSDDSTDETGSGTGATQEDILTVIQPTENQVIGGSTVKVEGRINERAQRVRINSYQVSIDPVTRAFSQDLSLRDETEVDIHIEALDARGVVIAETTRTVRRGEQSIPQPSITGPAKSGETYRTQVNELEIEGTAPAGVAGIMVNDYKLQLFRSGDTTWSYLASTALQNLRQGTNVYNVYSLDAEGNKSVPATITIILGEGPAGVVSSASSVAAGSSSSVTVVDESQLPKNDPLMPGTITVTGPTPGRQHTATGSEFLLEGTTPRETVQVWVNGYRLQLYQPGRTFWNYIAKTDYGTLKRGTNVYKITARNEKGEILDVFEYTVTYNP